MIEIKVGSLRKSNEVLQLPNRRFPSIVLQGDTHFARIQSLNSILCLLEKNDHQEALAQVRDLIEEMDATQKNYEKVLAKNNIALPY